MRSLNQLYSNAIPDPIKAAGKPRQECPKRKIELLISSLTPSRIAAVVPVFFAILCVWTA